jgi:protocatechuate 3,4-dioxygenase beta subunit
MRDFLPLFLLLAATASGQPLLHGEEQAAQTTSAVILGQVIDADTGDPIADAVVTLSGRPAPADGRRAGAPPATGNLFDLMAARGRGRGSAEQVAADSEGRFVFRGLPASRYTVRAQAAGYLPVAGGLTGGGGPATVEIAAGDMAARVVVRLWKEAVLTGVVLDEASEPIIRARVTAYRRNISRFGEVTFDQSRNGLTDDRGEYRIYGLVPGTYLIAVPQSHGTSLAAGADAVLRSLVSGQMPPGGIGGLGGVSSPMDPNAVRVGEFRLSSENVQSLPHDGGLLRAYRTVYHPAALSPAAAAPVTLRSGEERPGIDFALVPVVTGRITGMVTGPSGAGANVRISAIPADAPAELRGASLLPDVASGVTSADGTFTLLAVPPGQYRVVAEREAPDVGEISDELASNPMIKMAMAMRAAGAGTALYGEAAANVGDGETVEVAIAGSEGVTVTGEVRFDGTPPPAADIERIRVTLRALGRGTSGVRLIRVDQDGRFTAEGVFPGRYLASSVATVGGSPRLIRAVTVDGRDATTSPVVVGSDDIAIDVTFTDRVGSLRGTVRRDAVQGMARATAESRPLTAVVVPADYMTWTSLEAAADWVSIAPVAADDTFRAGPLLAGEYLVVVVDESAIDLSGGLAALQALAAQATRVAVGAGEATPVTVGVAGGRP